MITTKEVKSRIKWLLLAVTSFYLVFPLKNFVDHLFFGEPLEEHFVGHIVVGVIFLIIILSLFDLE